MSLCRKKGVPENTLETPLSRCLTTLDVTILAVGHMVGGGIYALTGQVAKDIAGPSVVICYIIAGLASCLSAICYAEFGTRLPKTGSAYSYVYMSLGELAAFLVGWNIILEHIVGVAAVARTWSGYMNNLFDGYIFNKSRELMPIHAGSHNAFVSDFPDFGAFGIILLVGIFTASGAKISVRANNALCVVNMVVIVFIVCSGIARINMDNWLNTDHGGFAPYGMAGIIAGASKCFFAYIGFDTVATAAEEMKSPAKSIPRATFASMFISTGCYVLMSSILTLAVPYQEIHPESAFAAMWENTNYRWFKYIVILGAGCATTTSIAGHLFALPRCVFAMAEDGIFCPGLAHVTGLTKVPSWTIMGLTLFSGVIATMIKLHTLVDLLAIGTLLAYGTVSIAILMLRYDEASTEEFQWHEMFSSQYSRKSQAVLLLVFIAVMTGLLNRVFRPEFTSRPDWPFFYGAGALFAVLLVVFFIIFQRIRQNPIELPYKVPVVPLIPLLSVVVNTVLLLNLPGIAWARLLVWVILGLVIYFSYSYWHSNERFKQAKEIALKDH